MLGCVNSKQRSWHSSNAVKMRSTCFLRKLKWNKSHVDMPYRLLVVSYCLCF